MNKPPKNKLQEVYQKSGEQLPTYNSFKKDDDWISEVVLYDGSKYSSDPFKRKTDAENDAASKALLNFTVTVTKNIYDLPRTVLLVDVENMPKIIEEIGETTHMDIYAFVGEYHVLMKKDFGIKVTKIISPSSRKDGTDTCMQVYIGYLLSIDEYDRYLIATNDHYGFALVDMINTNNFMWKNKVAKVITNVGQLST
jgi:hypothetical protein